MRTEPMSVKQVDSSSSCEAIVIDSRGPFPRFEDASSCSSCLIRAQITDPLYQYYKDLRNFRKASN